MTRKRQRGVARLPLREKVTAVTVAAVLAAAIGWPATASAVTGEEMCKAMHWPMPLPPTVGYNLEHLDKDTILTCFDNINAIAPDGHDVMNDPVNWAYTWKITSMSPPAGTMVPMNQLIKLTVIRDSNPPE